MSDNDAPRTPTRVKAGRTTADGGPNGSTADEKPYQFSSLDGSAGGQTVGNLDFILDIPLEITVELGRTRMAINELLNLSQGSVIGLTKLSGESLDILANQRLIAKGEAVVMNEKYGVRLTEVISPLERVERLK
jgi:flagellar motor switch protein FliN